MPGAAPPPSTCRDSPPSVVDGRCHGTTFAFCDLADGTISVPQKSSYRVDMARRRRSYLPGAVFHLTARTQGHEPWFSEPLRSRITEYIAAAIIRTDALLLAFAIMPNHLHLVIRQGDQPLTELMQPLLRRTALLVQRSRGIEGHVLERPYRDRACLDPKYVRNAIVYTHLNPVRGRITFEPEQYRWSSHAMYISPDAGPRCMVPVLAADLSLGLFAARDGESVAEQRRGYNEYLRWRTACDERSSGGGARSETKPILPPPLAGGDVHWERNFLVPGSADPVAGVGGGGSPLADLETIARSVLDDKAPDLPLHKLRSGSKVRKVVEVRRGAIVRMKAAGHRPGAIARYLRVSGSSVSRALATATRKIND